MSQWQTGTEKEGVFAGSGTKVSECLPGKWKALSSNLSTGKKKEREDIFIKTLVIKAICFYYLEKSIIWKISHPNNPRYAITVFASTSDPGYPWVYGSKETTTDENDEFSGA
jgi:hypothetical protein